MCYKGSVSEVFNTEFPFKEKDKRKKKKGFPPHPLYKEKEIKKEKETCYKYARAKIKKKKEGVRTSRSLLPSFVIQPFAVPLNFLPVPKSSQFGDTWKYLINGKSHATSK